MSIEGSLGVLLEEEVEADRGAGWVVQGMNKALGQSNFILGALEHSQPYPIHGPARRTRLPRTFIPIFALL